MRVEIYVSGKTSERIERITFDLCSRFFKEEKGLICGDSDHHLSRITYPDITNISFYCHSAYRENENREIPCLHLVSFT